MKMIIAYDGTLNAKTALKYGLRKLREDGGSAVVLSLFHSAMFVDYGAGPRAEEIARAESRRYVEDAKNIIAENGEGLRVRMVEKEGEPDEEILGLAGEESADLILAPPKYKSIIKKAPCPVVLVPGNILVPVDSTENSRSAVGRIADEALATGSKVILLGLVPVHMYGLSEKEELKKVEKDTRGSLREIKKALEATGVEAEELLRPGYPDEEILKAMEEFTVSMLMIPTVDETPSEISKAANIILDEPEKMKAPVILVPSTKTS